MGYRVLFSELVLYNLNTLQNKFNIQSAYLRGNLFLCDMYKKTGNELPSFLNGEFSFVLFDEKNDRYFCTRDPLGIKALYFTKYNKEYIFSSSIEDLLKLPDFIKKPNLNAISSIINQHTIEYAETMYENIFRLPPGHFMLIENGKELIERYWFPEKIKINYTITENESSTKLKNLLSKAINKRVTNFSETAFEVSGGLDSSSIVSLFAQKDIADTIDTYSMDFNDLKCDEGEYVDSILEKYPLDHQKVPASNLDYQHTYALKNLYELSPNWPIALTFAMSMPMLKKMQSDGKKVVISGQGGDHLFTGSPYVLYDLFRRFKFLSLCKELSYYSKRWSVFKSYVVKPLLGDKNIQLIKRLLTPNNIVSIKKQGKSILNLSQKTNIKNPTFLSDLDALTSAGQSAIMDSAFFHCAENYYGIEYRHPFFDIDLVEFSLSLPPEMKYKRRTIKWILRKAMDGILPDKIRDRKDKAEFSEVLIQQIDTIDLHELLDNAFIVKLGIIESKEINKYIQEYENKTVNYISTLWIIINVEYWYRYNFERESLSLD